MPDQAFMNQLTAFLQEQGYVWGPSPELYGGLSGFYEYGPLGKLLKNNVENTIRRVFAAHDFWEVECPTIMPAAVWKASGHLGNFTDPVVTCGSCGADFRQDHVDTSQPCPKCKKGALGEPKEHNLMMRTTVGLSTEAYARPETATTTYLPFNRYFDYFRKKLPFGVFQIGKAYRNEISPRQYMLRMREFTQAEAQLFLFKDQKDGHPGLERLKDVKIPFWPANADNATTITLGDARKHFLKNDAYAYMIGLAYTLFRSAGLPEEKLRLRQHGPDEKAFYADDAWDIEVDLRSFGWTEACGIHDRTAYDLEQHGKASKKPLTASDETHKKETPHILEIAFGPDRMLFSILDHCYDPKAASEGKGGVKFPASLAPIPAAVFPLVKKDGMPEAARALHDALCQELVATYDESGSVGRRYLRASQQGTPYCLTVDGQTLEDGTVTIRDRDTEEQKRIKKDDAAAIIHDLLAGKRAFNDL